MKLSKIEHKIKKDLAEREIEPSSNLWNNIQEELDKEEKPKPKVLWMRIAGVAAAICLCFLAYNGLQDTREILPTYALDQKDVFEQTIEFEIPTTNIVFSPKYEKVNVKSTAENTIKEPKIESTNNSKENLVASQYSLDVEKEVDSLLNEVNHGLAKADQDKLLTAEVENLLNEAIENTQDKEQKDILKYMQGRLLLAEVESEIELIKPPNLKDKIWEAIVSNYTDIKNSVVLN